MQGAIFRFIQGPDLLGRNAGQCQMLHIPLQSTSPALFVEYVIKEAEISLSNCK
jgi:hypothetical protein